MTKNKILGAIVVDTERCKGCALCVEACPHDVIALAEKKVNVHGYRYVACVGCTACASVCAEGCITVYRKKEEI